MKGREEFLEKLTQEEMDLLLSQVSEADYTIDQDAAERIRRNTMEKIRSGKASRKQRFPLHRLAAAVAVAASLSLLSPQVQAQVRRLVSLIPGIGMVERQGAGELLKADGLNVLQGEDKILSQPVILADENGIHLTVQIRQNGIDSTNGFPHSLDRFKGYINGKALAEQPLGMVSGGEDHSVYKIFIPSRVKAGDSVRFENDFLSFAVEGTLQTMDAQDPLSLPHARLADITVLADPVKSQTGWDIYMYSMSDKVTPTSFKDSLEFAGEIYFEAEGGARFPVVRPSSYGTGFMPPLSVKGISGKGDLVIPSLSYTTKDQALYALKIPDEGEVIEPKDGFTLGGVAVQVNRIYRNPKDPREISLDLSWVTDRLSLDFFWIEGTSGSGGAPGEMTVDLRPGYPALSRKNLIITEPEFTLKEELRIPLDLK